MFLFETLVDNLFIKFDKYIINNDLDNLILKMKDLHINIDYVIDKNTSEPYGKFFVYKNLIRLYLPKLRNYTSQQIIYILLHEYSHYIQEINKSHFF